MISRFGLFRRSILQLQSSVTINFTPKIYIKSKILNIQPGGYLVRDLWNSKKEGEEIAAYKARAWSEFCSLLAPDTYYVYLHKTRVTIDEKSVDRVTINEPGHIASFITNSKGNIIDGTVMSLRSGEILRDSKGEVINLVGDLYGKTFTLFTHRIIFSTIEIELKEYFFKQAGYKLPVPNMRYLIGLPITTPCLKDVLESVEDTKKAFRDKKYLLIDGKVDKVENKALNCISGVYSSNRVTGIMKNPQAHVAL
jgi:hypothetical protein